MPRLRFVGLADDGAAEQLCQFYSETVVAPEVAGAARSQHSAERVAVLVMGVRHAASCPKGIRDALYDVIMPEVAAVSGAVASNSKVKITAMSSAELLDRGAVCASLAAAMWLGRNPDSDSAGGDGDGGEGSDGGGGSAPAAAVEEQLSVASLRCLKAWKAAPDANGSRLVGALAQLANSRRCWAAGAGHPLGAATAARATAFFDALLALCNMHRPAAASKKQLAAAAAKSSNAAAAAAAAAGEAAAVCTAAGRVLCLGAKGGCTAGALRWFHTALDIIVAEKLSTPAADTLYQAARAVFNQLTKAADSCDRTAHLISCMEVVCKAAQYADATNPSRRASGVLSALQSSLANLYAKAKRPSDAFQACGSAIAMLPREKLENPDQFPREQMDKFVQIACKAEHAAAAAAAAAGNDGGVHQTKAKAKKPKKTAKVTKRTKKTCNASDDAAGDADAAGCRQLSASAALTINSFLQTLSLPDGAIIALLRLQWQCCRDSAAPEHTVGQQLQIVDELLHLVSAASAADLGTGSSDVGAGMNVVQEGAWLRVERARLYREVGSAAATPEAAVESCAEAIAMLKSLAAPGKAKGKANAAKGMASGDDQLPKTLLDDLASAYTWHGICARDCGVAGSNRSFRAAAGLWATLMGNMSLEDAGNAAFFRAPERTVVLLEAVATLFGLLEQSTDQVLVFQLIELMNSRVTGAAETSNTTMVAALSNAGHSMHRMGYLAMAESHFAEAEEALDGINVDYLLHHSRYLIATGNLQESQEEISRAVKEANKLHMNRKGGATPTLAAAEAISADAAFLNGQPAAAISLADRAFRLRVAQNRAASHAVAIGHETLAATSTATPAKSSSNSTVATTSDDGADGSGYIAGGDKAAAPPDSAVEDAAHWSRVHSQWQVMSELLESLYQMGQLHQLQGIPGASRFYFRKGLRFAEAAKLPNVRIRFLLALADVHCKQHAWKECSDSLRDATQIRAANTAFQSQQGPGGKHNMKLAEIRIAHMRGDAEFAQDRPKEAMKYLQKAATELRGVMAPTYIAALKMGRSVFQLASEGTPNEKAVAKAWSRTSGGSRGGGGGGVVGGSMLSDDGMARNTSVPADDGGNHDFPALSGELAVILARTALSQFRCAGKVDNAMIKEALSLFSRGRDESMVHYLIGLLHLEQATAAVSFVGAGWSGCCAASTTSTVDSSSQAHSSRAVADPQTPSQTPSQTPLPVTICVVTELPQTPGSGIAEPPSATLAAASCHEPDPLEGVNVSKWKVVELKAELKARGLTVAGKKADLVARLGEDIASNSVAYVATTPAPCSPVVNIAATTPMAHAPLHAPGPTSRTLPSHSMTGLPSSAVSFAVSSLTPSSTAKAAALAKNHFMEAFKICRKFADPTMLKEVCGALALLQGAADPTQTAFYLHNGLGITARQEMVIKVLRNEQRANDDDSSFLERKVQPSPTEELFSFSNVSSAGDFQRNYLDQLPIDLTVCSISLDPSGKALIVSRLQRGAIPTVQLLPIPSIAPFEANAAATDARVAATKANAATAPALGMVLQELKDVLVTSEDVIGTAKEVLATTDVEEKGRLMSEWWLRRGKLDDRIEAMLGVLESAVLGSGKTMFLGKLENQELADRVDKEAAELYRGLCVLAGPTQVSLPLCHRLVDGILEGLLSKDEVRAALVGLLGASSAKVDAATVILRPIEKRLAAGGVAQRGSDAGSAVVGDGGASGSSVHFGASADAGGSNLVTCTPRVGRVRKKGLLVQTPGGRGRGDGSGSSLAPKTPAVHRERAPPRMGGVQATPARSARPTTTKKAFARKTRLGAMAMETPAPPSFGTAASASAAAPPPIIPFTPSATMKKKRAHSRRPKEGGAMPPSHVKLSLSAAAVFLDEQPKQDNVVRKPICLILDKAVQSLPWESIPILQNAPVSRMPSLPFIVERANASAAAPSSKLKKKVIGRSKKGSSTAGSRCNDGGVHVVDGNKTFYVLNPSTDLKSTQRAFEANFEAQEGWDGIVGRAPTAEEYKAALVGSDVMVYCGHGAGQSFLNENQLEATQCRATTLLMGCSSGRLRDAGDFEPSGMALKYLLAGAPAVVANLWDVTDKDIDAVTATILEEWGPESDNAGLLNVVSKARDSCRLRFINGAAPVVYGLQVARDAQRKSGSA